MIIEFIIVNERTGEVMESAPTKEEAWAIREQYNELGRESIDEYAGTYAIKTRTY